MAAPLGFSLLSLFTIPIATAKSFWSAPTCWGDHCEHQAGAAPPPAGHVSLQLQWRPGGGGLTLALMGFLFALGSALTWATLSHALLLVQIGNLADRTPPILGIPWCHVVSWCQKLCTKVLLWSDGRIPGHAFSSAGVQLKLHFSPMGTSLSSGVCWVIQTKQVGNLCHSPPKPGSCGFNPVWGPILLFPQGLT